VLKDPSFPGFFFGTEVNALFATNLVAPTQRNLLGTSWIASGLHHKVDQTTSGDSCSQMSRLKPAMPKKIRRRTSFFQPKVKIIAGKATTTSRLPSSM
jgi:hypothetical protein